jgi:hypothetical protein
MKVVGVLISTLAAFFAIWVAIDFANHEKMREYANDQMSLHAFEKSPDFQIAVIQASEAEKNERVDAIMGGAAVLLLGAGFVLFESSVKSSTKRRSL